MTRCSYVPGMQDEDRLKREAAGLPPIEAAPPIQKR
jgi:hypothetical protein